MPDYQKDTPRQAALRREIETHAIWQYPPEERLQHNREWQSLYLLVFEFKNFLQKIEHRLQNTDASALAQDEEAMLDARYTRRSQLRGKLDTLTFTQAMRTAVAKFDTTSGKEFLAYFDAIYSNALHENVNKQATRDQGDIGLSSREGKLWKRVLDLCDKQGLDARRLPAPFYKQLADSLGLDEDALRRLIRNATSARRTFSLNEDGGDNGPAFDMADPGQDQRPVLPRLQAGRRGRRRPQEAPRLRPGGVLPRCKDIKDYPRLFFTTDVLGPLCAAKPTFPPECYCALLEKQEDLLWRHIFVRGYIDFLFDPAHPARLRILPDTPLAHPLRDSSVAAYQHVTPAAVSSQRKQYTALLHKMMAQMQG